MVYLLNFTLSEIVRAFKSLTSILRNCRRQGPPSSKPLHNRPTIFRCHFLEKVHLLPFAQSLRKGPNLLYIGHLPVADPTTPNSFIFTYVSAEKRPCRRSAPPPFNGKSWIRHCLPTQKLWPCFSFYFPCASISFHFEFLINSH